jgi:hypothetical protein
LHDSAVEKIAKEQVRGGLFFDGSPLSDDAIHIVWNSLERGEPMPYHEAIGGAYAYYFIPTGLGCAARVRHTEAGDELDLTDYDAGKLFAASRLGR